MNWMTIGWILGVVGLALAGILCVPLVLAALLAEPWVPFAIAAGITLAVGLALYVSLRKAERGLAHRDGFLTVTLVWVYACAVGSIPFALHPDLQLIAADALFEATSGFTTTGATVLSNLDTAPRSVLLWRSVMQWLGGMGMVVFGVALLPLLGVGGMQLYKAEAPGPTKDKMTPRIAETAKLLWMIYVGLTLAAGTAFFAAGMSAFDAVNHAMTSIATAGFSTHDASFGYFDSGAIDLTATLAMLAGGTSFAVLWRMFTGDPSWRRHAEFRTYFVIFCLATAVIALDLYASTNEAFPTPAAALRHASFQVASILTTTGYSTMDFDLWPRVSHAVLLGLFFVGGMAGSTSGGPKVIRILVLAKVAFLQFTRLSHPRAINTVRVGDVTVDERAVLGTLALLGIWAMLLGVGTVALSSVGADVFSSFAAAAVCLGNIGPGLGAVGPSHTFAEFDVWSKLVMCALMLLGRLEVYTVLVVLTPGFWRY